MIDPIDYQHSLDRIHIVEKIEQARKEMPLIEKDEFIKELAKQEEEKDTVIKEVQDANAETKVKDEKEKEQKQKEEKEKEEKEEKDEKDSDEEPPDSGHLIDIKA